MVYIWAWVALALPLTVVIDTRPFLPEPAMVTSPLTVRHSRSSPLVSVRRSPLTDCRRCVPCTAWTPMSWTSTLALLPAFLAQGLIMGGFELGATNTGIALAERGRVMEYSALQTAVFGLRGMIAPLLGTALLGAGLADTAVFALGTALVLAGWLIMARVST